MSNYNFHDIEPKWQKFWETDKTFKITEDASVPEDKRLYVLDMFPYPSAAGLHVGHPEGYTATDIWCRYKRMSGYHVLHPMGFDSFGLPAENYAIKTGTHPLKTTENNIQGFIKQIKALGFSYDWDRCVSTHESDYYHWTQWIFLQLFKKGLAYEADMPINWCPSCKTGLANEEVKDGGCDRCGTAVIRKNLRQWVLKITDYAENLLEDLDSLDWPNSVKLMQKNWIGKSKGANVTFKVDKFGHELEVYTTRPDTLFGATYMVLAPEHTLVEKICSPEHKESVEKYINEAAKKSDLERTDLAKEKSGVFTGAYAVNPVNNEKIPIWVADYVLISYGSGAIMAVPAHDTRDWEFAKQFELPITQVLEGGNIEKEAHTGEGTHINSGFLDGKNKEDAIKAMIEWLDEKKLGKPTTNYKLRDWIFSRQRYWGEPIPLVHCDECGIVPIDEKDLPLLLPEVQSYEPSGTGESPLANIDEWVNTTCPVCGKPAKRETNTMPQWAGSCWYYMRFLDPDNSSEFCSREKSDYWLPVDLYIGGAEHAVLHLLYSRFWHKVLFDLGLISNSEPFQRLINQGMILGEGGVKMSKSLGNVINPDDIIDSFGADSMRIYEMFLGPLQVSKPWATKGLTGVHRFLKRVWTVSEKEMSDDTAPKALKKLLHKTIKKVSDDTENLEFNTAISQMMIFINEMMKKEKNYRELWEAFILLLAPYAPHMSEEMWELMGHKESLAYENWPVYEEALTQDDMKTIIIQVNGKVRAKIDMPTDTDPDTMEKSALDQENVQKYMSGKTVVRIIKVPGKLVNIVVKG